MTLNNMSLGDTSPTDRLVLLREALALRGTPAATGKDRIDFARNLARTRQNTAGAHRSLGQLDEALRLLTEARDGLRRAVRDLPGHVIDRGDLASACTDCAELLNQLARPDEALSSAREAIAIFDELARVDPENSAYRTFLSTAHASAAPGHRRSRLTLLERIAITRPDNPQLQADPKVERAAIERLTPGCRA